ncbi:MAG: hemagglutinin repeat-containing protein [Gammaproteobacteria bacterium]|nr:hemagglutinin repeat-containing protein [Gammaproteobacteria bacterium]
MVKSNFGIDVERTIHNYKLKTGRIREFFHGTSITQQRAQDYHKLIDFIDNSENSAADVALAELIKEINKKALRGPRHQSALLDPLLLLVNKYEHQPSYGFHPDSIFSPQNTFKSEIVKEIKIDTYEIDAEQMAGSIDAGFPGIMTTPSRKQLLISKNDQGEYVIPFCMQMNDESFQCLDKETHEPLGVILIKDASLLFKAEPNKKGLNFCFDTLSKLQFNDTHIENPLGQVAFAHDIELTGNLNVIAGDFALNHNITCANHILINALGDCTFGPDALIKTKSITTQTKNLDSSAQFIVEENASLAALNNLVLNPTHQCLAQNIQYLANNTIEIAGISKTITSFENDNEGDIEIIGTKKVILKDALLDADNDIFIDSDFIHEDSAVEMNANCNYLQGRNYFFVGKNNINFARDSSFVETKKLLCNGKIDALNDLSLQIEYDKHNKHKDVQAFMLEKEGRLNAHTISLNTPSAKFYGDVDASTMHGNIHGPLKIYKTSNWNVSENLRLTANTHYLTGNLHCAKANVLLRTNRHFIRGLMPHEKLILNPITAVNKRAFIEANNLQIISGAYIDVGTRTKATTSCAFKNLLDLDLGLIESNATLRHRLFGLDLTLNVPNVTKVLETINHIIHLDFSELQTDVFNKDHAYQALNLLIIALKLIFTDVGLAANIVVHTGTLLLDLPQIFQELEAIKENWDDLELCDVIPLIVNIKGVVADGYHLVTSSMANHTLDHKNQTVEKNKKVLTNIERTQQFCHTGFSSLTPHYQTESLIDINLKGVLTGNLHEESALNITLGSAQCAENISKQFYVGHFQHDNSFSHNLSYFGQYLSENGHAATHNLVTEVAHLVQGPNSTMHADTQAMQVENFDQQGTWSAKQGSTTINYHDIHPSATYTQDGGSYTSTHTDVAGLANLNHQLNKISHLNIGAKGSVVTDYAEIDIPRLKNENQLNISNGSASIQQLKNRKTGTVNSVKSKLDIQDIKNRGSISLDQSLLQAASFSNANHFDAKKSIVKVNHFKNFGHTAFRQSQVKFDAFDNLKNSHTQSEDTDFTALKINNHRQARFGFKSSQVEVELLHNAGATSFEQSQVKINDFENIKKGSVQFADSELVTSMLNNKQEAELEIKRSKIEAFHLINDGDMKADQANLSVNHLQNNNQASLTETDLQTTTFITTKQLDLNQSRIASQVAMLHGETAIHQDNEILSDRVKVAGQVTIDQNASLILNGKDELELTETSDIKGGGLFLHANDKVHIDPDAVVDVDKLYSNFRVFPDAHDYIAGKGYHVNANQLFYFKSPQDLIIDFPLRACDNYLLGKNIAVRPFAPTPENLKYANEVGHLIDDNVIYDPIYNPPLDSFFFSTDPNALVHYNLNHNLYLDASEQLDIYANMSGPRLTFIGKDKLFIHQAPSSSPYIIKELTLLRHLLHADDLILSGDTIQNDNGYLKAHTITLFPGVGGFTNFVGMVRADQLLYGDALGDIINIGLVPPYRNNPYIPGILEGYDSYLHTKGQVIGEAGDFLSDRDLLIDADQGVEARAKIITLSSSHDKSSYLGFSKSSKTITEDFVYGCNFKSKTNKIHVNSNHADINTYAANFSAPVSTILSVDGENHKVRLYDVLTSKRIKESGSSWCGLASHSSSQENQNNVTTKFNVPEHVTVVSHQSDIDIRGAQFQGNGKLSLGAGNDINVSIPILDHHYHATSQGFATAICGVPILQTQSNESYHPTLTKPALINDFNQLTHSNDNLSTGLNLGNVIVDGADTANTILGAFENGNYIETLGNEVLPQVFNPNISLTYSKTKIDQDWQTLGNGFIDVGELEIIAPYGNVTFDHAIPVHVKKHAYIEAEKLIENGVALASQFSAHQQSLTATGYLSGDVTVDYRENNSLSKNQQWVNQSFSVNGPLELHVGEWCLNGAKVQTRHLAGDVNQLEIKSHLSHKEESNHGFTASTRGNFEVNHGSSNESRVKEMSGIEIIDDLNASDNEFTVYHIRSEAGAILSHGKLNLHPETFTAIPIHEHTESTQQGVGINKGVAPFNNNNSSHLSTLSILSQLRKEKSILKPKVYGASGTDFSAEKITGSLVTTSENSRQITHETNKNYQTKLPLYDANFSHQFAGRLKKITSPSSGIENDVTFAAPDQSQSIFVASVPEDNIQIYNSPIQGAQIVSYHNKQNELVFVYDAALMNENYLNSNLTQFISTQIAKYDNPQICFIRKNSAETSTIKPEKEATWFDYLSEFNAGVERAKTSLVHQALHPIDEVIESGRLVRDGYNAMLFQTTGISFSKEADKRNTARGIEYNKMVDDYMTAKGPQRVGILAEAMTNLTFGFAMHEAKHGAMGAGLDRGLEKACGDIINTPNPFVPYF